MQIGISSPANVKPTLQHRNIGSILRQHTRRIQPRNTSPNNNDLPPTHAVTRNHAAIAIPWARIVSLRSVETRARSVTEYPFAVIFPSSSR